MQALRYFGIALPLGNLAQDVGFARAERRYRAGVRPRSKPSEHNVRNSWIEVSAALSHDAYGFDKTFRLGAFQAIRVGSGGKRGDDFLFQVHHGNDHDMRLGNLGANAPRKFDTVDSRQSDVDDGDAWPRLHNQFESRDSVGGLADDLEICAQRCT